MEARICTICGKEFQPTHFNQKRCPGPHFKQCPVCGKQIPWTEYDRCCSAECTQKKREATSLEVYGCKHPQSSERVQAKMRATFQEHYGVDYPGQDKAIRAKQVASYKDHYGRKENPEGCNLLTDKRRVTCLSKYGVLNPMQSEEVRAKAVATSIERYGVANYAQTEECQLKMRHTLLEHYGVENCMQAAEVKERLAASVSAKYGVKCALLSSDVIAKTIQTNIEKYGVPWYCMTDECKTASGKIVSKLNRSFQEFLLSHGIASELEFRIGAYSFDLKVDNILIEIDPTFTHTCAFNPFDRSEKGLDADYHLRKTQLANENGYRCIHIFDWDDWNKVVNVLLSDNTKEVDYARNYAVDEDVAIDECKELLTCNHLQGPCNGQAVRIGLRNASGQLVQLMSFGAPRYNRSYQYELLRLCTVSNVKIVGGASRLFKHFLRKYSPDSIISYCDVAKFDGHVYSKLGFTLNNISQPNKIWCKNGKMITDNLLRQRGFDQLFGTSYGKGTSNEELMLQHYWFPIYDCGQRVFEWRKKDVR